MRYLIFTIILTSSVANAKGFKNPIQFDRKHYEVVKTIVEAADKADAPRELVLAVCWNESSFRVKHPKLNRIDGEGDNATMSYGICQVKLETAQFVDQFFKLKHKITVARLKTPYVNAYYAAKLLTYYLNYKYEGNWQKAIDAYNKGHVVSTKSIYVKKVMHSVGIAKVRLPEVLGGAK